MNLWMMAGSLQITDLAAYAQTYVNQLLTKTDATKVPALVRQSIAAWQLGEKIGGSPAGEGYAMLKSAMEYVLCRLQVRSARCRQAGVLLSLRGTVCEELGMLRTHR
jgi:hypothetical protein